MSGCIKPGRLLVAQLGGHSVVAASVVVLCMCIALGSRSDLLRLVIGADISTRPMARTAADLANVWEGLAARVFKVF